MQEEFLHYIWRHRHFSSPRLKTMHGEDIDIIHPGEYNTNAGPDFLNAMLKIGDTIWAGHVEMHLNEHDWLAHGHQNDASYNNVVLHVVANPHASIRAVENIPLLNLNDYIHPTTAQEYHRLHFSKEWVPCFQHINTASVFSTEMWLERMLIERLESKAQAIREILKATGNDWAETTYRLLARSFGFSVNKQAFERLAEILPFKIITKHAESHLQLDALVFGQAGWLADDIKDEYIQALRKEYKFLSTKYALHPMHYSAWKFLRMRPDNFPTIRLAQFAALMQKSDRLFSKILEIGDIEGALNYFEVHPSAYWQDHYKPGTIAKAVSDRVMGSGSRELLIVNVIAPLLYFYGAEKKKERYKDQAIDLLEKLHPEKNNITNGWVNAGLQNTNAARSQALLHLKKTYCENKKCLECGIGAGILKRSAKASI